MNIALDASTLSLRRDGLIAVRDGEGSRIRCLSGSLWVTEEQGGDDVVLEPGEGFTIRRPGLTLIMALQPTTLQLAEPKVGVLERLGAWMARLLPRRAVAAAGGC